MFKGKKKKKRFLLIVTSSKNIFFFLLEVYIADTQTGMVSVGPETAICVQRFDDSQKSAIHITYRSSLRSSSMHKPRDPPSKVVFVIIFML